MLSTNRTLAVIVYGALCGLLMLLFVLIGNFSKYIFSLCALFLAIRFFGQYETWGVRTTMIAVSFAFFLLFLITYAFFGVLMDWPLPDGSRK